MRASDRLSGWLLKDLSAVWVSGCAPSVVHTDFSPVFRGSLHASPHSQTAPLQASFFPLNLPSFVLQHIFSNLKLQNLTQVFVFPHILSLYSSKLQCILITILCDDNATTYCHPKASWMTVWNEKHFQKCIFSSTELASCQNVTKT